jgi:hypothetical protein
VKASWNYPGGRKVNQINNQNGIKPPTVIVASNANKIVPQSIEDDLGNGATVVVG